MKSPHFRQQWRDFQIVSGTPESAHQHAIALLAGKGALWVGKNAPAGFAVHPADKLSGLLGQDVVHLVFDALDSFDADAFAVAAGLVKGGGLFLLLTPPLAEWGGTPDVSESADLSLFCRRFAHYCGKYRQHDVLPGQRKASSAGDFITSGQRDVIAALKQVAHGHRKRPLVVTADRGRGKSAAFGMGAAQLLTEGTQYILVTAPRLNATLALFEHAGRVLPDASQQRGLLTYGGARLQFIAPDELLQQLPEADLLLVDEAAGIPVPLLEKLLQHYKRIAFATTVHGYEGSGRGFSLRFGKVLDRIRPQWKRFIMQEPVRWAADDPLEQFVFQTLLLDAEPVAISDEMPVALDKLIVAPLPKDELMHDEALLRHVFGLLVSAHYRTTPTDLQHLLDAPNLRVWVGWLDELPVAAMLVATEGPLPSELHEQIMQGKRRPAGQLLPLAVASQCGQPEVLSLSCERVVRIAVHPVMQHRGIGSRMLETLLGGAPERGVDLVGSSFGAAPELVDFWRKNHFQPVRLGYRREASSGAHSVLMLHGVAPAAKATQEQAGRQFVAQFPLQLAEVFSGLEPALVRALLKGDTNRRLSAADRQSLQAFAHGGRQYLDCLLSLHNLALVHLASGEPDTDIFVLKLLQGRNWQETAAALGLSGKKAVLEALRQRIKTILPI